MSLFHSHKDGSLKLAWLLYASSKDEKTHPTQCNQIVIKYSFKFLPVDWGDEDGDGANPEQQQCCMLFLNATVHYKLYFTWSVNPTMKQFIELNGPVMIILVGNGWETRNILHKLSVMVQSHHSDSSCHAEGACSHNSKSWLFGLLQFLKIVE